MPIFKCVYRDKKGKLIEETKTAKNRDILIRDLRKNNYFPIKVEDSAKSTDSFKVNRFYNKEKEVAVFTRQLANLLSSGVDLTRTLNLLVDHTKSSPINLIVAQIRDEVIGGGYFWEAFSRHPKLFSSLYVGMIRAGELGESLVDVVNHLADYLEKYRETKGVITSMLIYPIILLLVGIATIIFIMTFVFPQMLNVFTNMGEKSLPVLTKILIALSAFLTSYGVLLVILLIVSIVVVQQLYSREKYRLKIDQSMYHWPILGSFIQKVIFVRFTQIMGLILGNGVSIVESLEIAPGVVQNKYVVKKLDEVKRNVVHGSSLSLSLTKAGIFSPLMVNMIAIAEETGNLDDTLKKVSTVGERELQEDTKRFVNMLEPMLICILALAVGFMVAAILLPIFQMDLTI